MFLAGFIKVDHRLMFRVRRKKMNSRVSLFYTLCLSVFVKKGKPFRLPARLMTAAFFLAVNPGFIFGQQDISGAWSVTVNDPKNSYQFEWQIRKIGTSWWVERKLVKTSNSIQNWMVGRSFNEYSLTFKDGIWEYRGRFGAKDQWAACTFREDAFSCKGSQKEFTLTDPITIEGKRPFRIIDTPPGRAETASSGTEGYGAQIMGITGDAEVIREGSSVSEKLSPGMKLSRGDRIVTGMDSVVKLLLPDDTNLEIKELTDFKVEKLFNDRDSARTLLWLKAGEVSAEINPNRAPKSDFAIKVNKWGGHSRGTRFTVRHNQQTGITTFSVTKGTIEILHENRSVQGILLRANQKVDISGDQVSRITNITDNPQRQTKYTAQQINYMRQWIVYYDNLIVQWTHYRDQRVAPYWNDPTFFQWARAEYQRCNQQIQLSQQYKAYYEDLLRQAGVR